MSYINKSVSINGTEKDFIKAFANELTSADGRITCETDIDAEFNKEKTYNPVIIFNINNCYKIKFKRQATLSNQTKGYYVTCIINGNETTYSKYLEFSQYLFATDVANRLYKFSIVRNTNFLSIKFAGYNYVLPLKAEVDIFSYHTDNFNVVSKESDTAGSATQRLLIRTDETGKGDAYTFANRLNYDCKENVEIIESKVLIQSNNAERTVTGIIDCSTVSKDSIINIDDSKYYALDEHTLALI